MGWEVTTWCGADHRGDTLTMVSPSLSQSHSTEYRVHSTASPLSLTIYKYITLHITSHHLTPSSALLAITSHHSHSSFPVPKGINMTAPPNHPDPIYAGFSRPFERNPTTRVPTGHHRGGESGHSMQLVNITHTDTSDFTIELLILHIYRSVIFNIYYSL